MARGWRGQPMPKHKPSFGMKNDMTRSSWARARNGWCVKRGLISRCLPLTQWLWLFVLHGVYGD